MDCGIPGFSAHHDLLEFAQTHTRWVTDAIQTSHPLLPPSPLAFIFPSTGSFPMSQLFTSCGQNIGASASVHPVIIQLWFTLGLTDLISLLSKVLKSLLQHYSWKHQFFSAQPSLWSDSHIHSKLLGKSIALARQTFSARWWVSAF